MSNPSGLMGHAHFLSLSSRPKKAKQIKRAEEKIVATPKALPPPPLDFRHLSGCGQQLVAMQDEQQQRQAERQTKQQAHQQEGIASTWDRALARAQYPFNCR